MSDTMQIPLTQGKFALVDAEDYLCLSQFKWQWRRPHRRACEGHEGYAMRTSARIQGKRKTIFMHNEIMHPPMGMEVDHIRIGSGLDNSKANLRIVDKSTNRRNRHIFRNNKSGYRGVSWNAKGRVWQAGIGFYGKLFHLGSYATAKDASAAYEAARERLGLLKAESDR